MAWMAPRSRHRCRPQDREWRQHGKWPQMESSPWTQERAVLSPRCRRARFLPQSDPAAPFFVLHRPAQRMGGDWRWGQVFFVAFASRCGATKVPHRRCQRAAVVLGESLHGAGVQKARPVSGSVSSRSHDGAVCVLVGCSRGAAVPRAICDLCVVTVP